MAHQVCSDRGLDENGEQKVVDQRKREYQPVGLVFQCSRPQHGYVVLFDQNTKDEGGRIGDPLLTSQEAKLKYENNVEDESEYQRVDAQ